MARRILLFFILAFALHNCKAQQVYECKAMGFKFVMDCECAEVDMQYPKPGQTYKMNMVPLVTYVAEGSPAAAMRLARNKLFRVGDTILYDKTPEQIIAIFENPGIAGQELWVNPKYNYNSPFQRIPPFSSPYSFPEPKFAPVPDGPLFLATIVGEYKKAGELLVLYENGDEWHGQVVHEMYPRYSDKNGMYWTHDSRMKIHFDKNKPYQDSVAVVRKQFIADSISAKIIADKKKIEIDSLTKIYTAQMLVKHKIDSVNNLKTAKQLVATIDDSGFANHLVCGVGIDIKLTNGWWAITEVEKYSPAWLAGLTVGDRLTSVGGNRYVYSMSKLEFIQKLCTNINDTVSLNFMRPSEETNEMKATMHCFKIYNRPASLSKGGCLSGDCQNGTGIFEDAKGTIYDGPFVNGKLNGKGSITMPHDSMVVNSEFVNGLKNGSTTIYTGRAELFRSPFNVLSNAPIYFTSDFINDVPDGYGIICYNALAYYSIRYQNGIVQGKALRILNDRQYIYCDPTSRYTLTNCLQYEGTPTDLSMMKPNSRPKLNTSGTTVNTNNNSGSNSPATFDNVASSITASQQQSGWQLYESFDVSYSQYSIGSCFTGCSESERDIYIIAEEASSLRVSDIVASGGRAPNDINNLEEQRFSFQKHSSENGVAVYGHNVRMMEIHSGCSYNWTISSGDATTHRARILVFWGK